MFRHDLKEIHKKKKKKKKKEFPIHPPFHFLFGYFVIFLIDFDRFFPIGFGSFRYISVLVCLL